MTAIMTTDHMKIIKRIKRKHRIVHLIGILVTSGLLLVPYLAKLDRDIFSESYRVAREEINTVMAKQELLGMLRGRAITLGQGLDICDAILSQDQVPVSIVLAVIAQESNFKPDAVSHKGARGLMQVLPSTFAGYSSNSVLRGPKQIHDPLLNLQAGISYLADLQRTYKDWRKSLRGYYAGVSQADNKAHDVYASAVLLKAAKWEKQIGGEK